MTSKTHAALALILCSAACVAILAAGPPLIGLVHGPSDERDALGRQRSVRRKLDDIADGSWGETAELVLEPYLEMAYRDRGGGASILRDAGVVAAFFALLLVFVPGFLWTRHCRSKGQRMCVSLLALMLCVAPGLVGQVIFEKTAPVEILLLETWGPARGFSYVAYCSMKSLLLGLGDDDGADLSALFVLFHEAKVVAAAGFLVFLVLGLVPPPGN